MISRGRTHHFPLYATTASLAASLLVVSSSSVALARDRLPLQKKLGEIAQPAPVTPELEGHDKSGNPIYWNPQPRVVSLGGGRYAFKWIGRHGRELTLIYERPDAIDIVVEALLTTAQGRITYSYKIRSLPTSKLPLGGFCVQNFSPNASAEAQPGIHTGIMGSFVKEFREGRWLRFAPLVPAKAIAPGQSGVYSVSSADPPAVVECRAHGGDLGMKGVGEEPPGVLLNLCLGHDAWPHGYTIGPDERLAKMSVKERTNYLLQRLPQMLELGWIENQKVMQWYETNLKAGKVAEVRARAKADFDNNLITSEVLALITYLAK